MTDAYFYLFSVGLVPIMCLIVGMMYPALLNERRMSRSGLVAIRRWTTALGPLFVLGGAGWLAYRGRLPEPLWVLAGCGLLLAAAQARVWFRAVAAEAGGDPGWISGIALAPNLLAVLVLGVPWTHSASSAVAAMMIALLAGNLGLLAVMARRGVGRAVLDAAPAEPTAGAGHFWFLTLSTVGYLGQVFLQSLAVLLPASSITFLNVGLKIVGSTSATFVNASMPVLVHQSTDSPAAARRFLRVVMLVVGAAGVALVVAAWIGRPELLRPAAVVGLWLIASSAQAVAFRLSYRFRSARSTTRTIAVVLAVTVLSGVSAHVPGFDLGVALCGYAMLDAASALLLLLPLRDRWMSAALAAVVAGLAGIWLAAYR